MKTIMTAVFVVLACAGVRADDAPDGNPLVDVAPPPAAPTTVDLGVASLNVSEEAWKELQDDLQPIGGEDAHEHLSPFVGDTTRIREWVDRQLQNHQVILSFELRGKTSAGRAWQANLGTTDAERILPMVNESGDVRYYTAGLRIVGPNVEILPIASRDDSLLIDVGYLPVTVLQDVPDAPAGERRELIHTGELSLSRGQSLVLLTDEDLGHPVSLLVVSASDGDELIAIHSNGPTPDAATARREAVAGGETASLTTAPTHDDELRFYPLVGLARLTASGELVREDGTVIVPASVTPSAASESEPQQPDVSAAGQTISLTPGEQQTIEMHEHEARRVSLEKKIRSASGFNPEVIEVTASGTNGLNILSFREGATRLTIVDEDDVPLELTVVVSEDTTELELLLERLYPETDVEIVPIRDTVLLRGTVEDAEQVRQIQEIAEQFAPRVLNQLAARSAGAALEIPPGFRLVTITSRQDSALSGLLRPGDHVDVLVTFNRNVGGNEPGTVTRTLLSGVRLFARTTSDDNPAKQISVLVRPAEADALSIARQTGTISVSWRNPGSIDENAPRLNEDVVRELRRQIAAVQSDPAESQPPVYPLAPYPGTGSPELVWRVIAIGIGTEAANLGGAEPGNLVDLLASDPGPASPPIAERVRLVGVVAPKDDAERFVWLIVSPHQAKVIEERQQSSDVQFTVRKNPDGDAAWPSYGPLPDSRPAPQPDESAVTIPVGSAGSEPDLESDLQSLRDDIRALHEDVRRLIELLEDRQDHEADERVQPDDAGTARRTVPETSRAWTELGIRVEEIASSDARLDDQPYRGAVVITQVRDGSPASRAGLQSGDLLVGLHVWETISPENVDFVLSHPQLSSFTTLKFYVLRGRDTLFGHLQLQERTSLELQLEKLTGHYMSFESPTPFNNQPTGRPLPVPEVNEPSNEIPGAEPAN